jgi:site-specific recombinase XerC
VFLPDRLVSKLKRFWAHKRRRGEGVEPGDPLFCNQSRRRISKRRVQFAWRTWQQKAGFDRLYPFHSLRHHADFGIMPTWRRARTGAPLCRGNSAFPDAA